MSQPGWYPDPSGRPGHYRHWDGGRWSEETTTDPARTPPPGFAGAPHGTGPGPTGPQTTGRRPGWGVWLLVIGVVVAGLVAFLVVRGLTGSDTIAEDDNSSTPTVSQWDETSTPTQTPSPTNPDASGGTQMTCPDVRETNPDGDQGDRVSGGGISFAKVDGWNVTQQPLVDYADDQAGQEQSFVKSWIGGVAIGQVAQADFGDARTAASRIFSCEASSQYYPGYQGHTITSLEPVTIDGHEGFRLIGEVRDNYYPEVQGDVLDIIVLDVGRSGKLAFFKGMSPIGEDDWRQKVIGAADSLTAVG